MLVRNFLTCDRRWNDSHGSGKQSYSGFVFQESDFDAPIHFVRYSTYPPGSGVGPHTHGNDQELYVILEGRGTAEVNGERREVTAGDIIVNPPYANHALRNTGETDLTMLLLEIACKD